MNSKYSRVISATRLKFYIFVIALNVLFIPSFSPFVKEGFNRFSISVNGVFVGTTEDESLVYDYLREARRQIAVSSDDIVFLDFPDITCQGESILYGEIDDSETVINNIKNVISSSQVETLQHAYSIKVEDTILYVAGADEVQAILQSAVDRYDMKDEFTVVLNNDNKRQLNVLYPTIEKTTDMTTELENQNRPSLELGAAAGFERAFSYTDEELFACTEGFDAYDYGIISMEMSKDVEIVEAYVPTREISEMDFAADALLNEQEIQQVYKVKAGDTLSEISLTCNIPLDELIALNSSLENEFSVIQIDQELIITVPEPALTVNWVEVARLEEAYNLPTEYVYNDEWYTTKSETLVQPSAGYHEAVLQIYHNGNTVENKENLYELILIEPIAKVVEIGTIEPPTFIRPLSGGRISSYFGYRNSPTAGASSYHEGVDYYTPIGSSVYASTSGTVTRAGWSGGYGYCVDVTASNGVLTRYAHLSKVYVSVGQYVTQGDVVAASGSTGISTGPHLHFEIRFNGSPVNPLDYVY